MNVLHVYKTFWTESFGGVEQAIRQIALSTTESAGVRNTVLTLARCARPESLRVDGINVERFPLDLEIASTGMSRSALRGFRALVDRADVVHYHFPWPFADVMHFVTQVRKPTLLTYHSDIVRQRFLLRGYRPLLRWFLKSVGHIVATSPNYFSTSDVLHRYRDKVSVIPLGLDTRTYGTPAADKLAYWRSRFGNRFFLFVGNIRYYKGLHVLLDACRGADFPVVIVGAGPVEAELREHARRLNLTHIHFLGVLPEEDKIALFSLCHAVVFPSCLRAEAFGLSLLEGALFGRPLISSEIGTGTSFINNDGETGIVVPPNDPVALRAAMQFMLDHPDRAEAFGRAAARRFKRLFTAERMASDYTHLYRALVHSGGKVPLTPVRAGYDEPAIPVRAIRAKIRSGM